MSAEEPERLDAGSLFRRWAAFVAGLLARAGVAPGDLDDAVQEVFLTAHRRGGFVADRAHEKTWLAEIAIRVASNYRRSKRRSRIDGADRDVARTPSPHAGPGDAAEIRERIERVARALDVLPLAQRVAFVLYEIEGETCEAIARGIGVPVGTVYSRLHVARRAFRAAYDAGEDPRDDAEPAVTELVARVAR